MATATFDPERKFVRVIERHASGLVEFEFAMGEPELCAEMVMPETAFAAFCEAHQVTFLTAAPEPAPAEWDWNLRDATHQRFRHPGEPG